MQISCGVDIPEIKGLVDGQLTVGREFYLACKGEWPKNLKQEKIQVIGDENIKYQLKVLGFEFRSPEEADLKVVSYMAGKYDFPKLQITDGEQTLDLGPLKFEVVSVLPKEGEALPGKPTPNPAEAPAEGQAGPAKLEPYGPMGPATISVPLLYWLLLLGAILTAALLISLKVWRFNQRRAMLLRLKDHDSALSPVAEFHQSMRRLQRSSPVFFDQETTEAELSAALAELSKMFKVYISRRLKVPAFEWNERLIIADIKKYHFHVYEVYSKRIRDLFSEFKKAESAGNKLQDADVVQLAASLRKTLEGVEQTMIQASSSERGDK